MSTHVGQTVCIDDTCNISCRSLLKYWIHYLICNPIGRIDAIWVPKLPTSNICKLCQWSGCLPVVGVYDVLA